MRPRLYFDGAPDRFERTQALFSTTSRLRVKWAAPIARKFRLSRIALAVEQWKRKHAA